MGEYCETDLSSHISHHEDAFAPSCCSPPLSCSFFWGSTASSWYQCCCLPKLSILWSQSSGSSRSCSRPAAHAAAEAAVRAQQAQGVGVVGPSGNIGPSGQVGASGNIGPSGLCGPTGCIAF